MNARRRRVPISVAALLLVAVLPAVHAAEPMAAASPAAQPSFTRAQLRADLEAIEAALRDMPPDLAYTADLDALDRAKRRIATVLDSAGTLTRDETWRLFATLNPVFADGHLLISFVDWRGDTRAHLAAGGRLFPFEVRVTERGDITVLSALGGAADPLAGATVESVNGVAARELFADIMARVPGDTPAFRAGILSQRFWLYYWKLYGAPATFDVGIAGKRHMRVAGGATLPVALADEASFERLFTFELLQEDAALLTVGSFVWEDKARFLAFTRAAFGKMKAAGTKTLIIDIRANTGGNDDMWIEGILPYLADKPFRWASRYRKRVVVADPAKNEKVGDLVEGELETWIQPQPENPLHFPGRVFVLVGPATYSSSIVFSVVMQDFGFASIAGEGAKECVRASQTGGTRRTTLPNSGLVVIAPRFVLTRPSGAKLPLYLKPDIELPADPLHPRAAVEALIASHGP